MNEKYAGFNVLDTLKKEQEHFKCILIILSYSAINQSQGFQAFLCFHKTSLDLIVLFMTYMYLNNAHDSFLFPSTFEILYCKTISELISTSFI